MSVSSPLPLAHRLAVRLALGVLALVGAVAVAVALWASHAADDAAVAADQSLHRSLAAELAPRLQPHLETTIDRVAIQGVIADLTQINRRLDVYLLGSNGMIKSWFSDGRRRPLVGAIDPAPLDAFLAGAPLPLLGMDPARPEARRPFAVAPVRIMGEEGCYLYLILQGERYDAVAQGMRRAALGSTLGRGLALALAAALAAGLLLVVWLTRPLSRLTDAVDAFERGAHVVRARADGRGEVARLAGAFNRMAARIAAQVEALQRTDRQRRELVANVSHDLRSPLAALRGSLETIEMGGLAPADRDAHVTGALRAAERLSALVDDLFDLSRFDAAEIRPTLEPTALPELVADAAAVHHARADAAGVTLRVRAADGLPLVRADAGLVERAVANLVDNALRHTPSGGAVYVDVSRADGGALAVAVRDTGPGLAPEVLPRVFDRFVRGDASRRADGGAGLGLAIVRHIAELHGGRVRAESVLGAGATFTITLPIAGPSARAPEPHPQAMDAA